MNLFGISNRAWRLWGLVNGGFSGAFYLVYEIIGIVLPSEELLMLQNLILAGVFAALAAISVFVAETPRRSTQGGSLTDQQEPAIRSDQDAGSQSQDMEDTVRES